VDVTVIQNGRPRKGGKGRKPTMITAKTWGVFINKRQQEPTKVGCSSSKKYELQERGREGGRLND